METEPTLECDMATSGPAFDMSLSELFEGFVQEQVSNEAAEGLILNTGFETSRWAEDFAD